MATAGHRFPYNPDGLNPDCKVTGEVHTLTAGIGADYQFIIPKQAPFFGESMRVRHVASNRTLQVNRDYVLTHLFGAAKIELDKFIYGSVTILDSRLSGDLTIDYVTLGGDFTADEELLLRRTVSDLTGHRTVDYADIADTPPTFPVTYHHVQASGVVGMGEVTKALTNLNLTLTGANRVTHRHRMSDVDGLEATLSEKLDSNGAVRRDPLHVTKVRTDNLVNALVLPKFIKQGPFELTLLVQGQDVTSRIRLYGTVLPTGVPGDQIVMLKGTADNNHFVDTVWGSYAEVGRPILYFRHATRDFRFTALNILEVCYAFDDINLDLTGDYQWLKATNPVGGGADFHITATDVEVARIEKRLQKLKINTLLNETVYDVI